METAAVPTTTNHVHEEKDGDQDGDQDGSGKWWEKRLLFDGMETDPALIPTYCFLSDRAVAAILIAGFDPKLRHQYWPGDFGENGKIYEGRVHRGSPAITADGRVVVVTLGEDQEQFPCTPLDSGTFSGNLLVPKPMPFAATVAVPATGVSIFGSSPSANRPKQATSTSDLSSPLAISGQDSSATNEKVQGLGAMGLDSEPFDPDIPEGGL